MATGDSLLAARDQLLGEIADIDTGIGRLVDRRNRLIEAANLLSELAIQAGSDPVVLDVVSAHVEFPRRTQSSNGYRGSAPKQGDVESHSRSAALSKPSTPAVVAAHMSRAPERWFTSTDLRRETSRKSGQINSALQSMLERGEIEREGADGLPGVHAKTRWQYRWVGEVGNDQDSSSVRDGKEAIR